ncbi:MAG: hypothetical protein RL660_2972 [Bacteroidota bacterium]
METLTFLLLILVFIYVIFLVYRKDIKDGRAQRKDFVNLPAILVGIFLCKMCGNFYWNYNYETYKYLTANNKVREEVGLVTVDSTKLVIPEVFSSSRSYFGSKLKHHTMTLLPRKQAAGYFQGKYVMLDDKVLSFEEDTYIHDSTMLRLSYNYSNSSARYKIGKVPLGHKMVDSAYHTEEITKARFMDSIATWQKY